MNLSQLAAWAIAHPESAALSLTVVATSLSSLYAAVKVTYQRVTGRAAKGRVWTVLDVAVELLPNLPGAINRWARAGGSPSIFAPPSTPSAPPSRTSQSGAVRVGTMLALCVAVLVASVTGAVLTGCPPTPPVDGGVAVTPSGWTSTARVVLDTLRWAVPAARAITDSVVPEPARTQVGRALDATGDAARELSAAVDAYELRGGDRCAAHAAVGGLHRALVGLARVLADSGIALGTTLERVVDGVASIADALVPACDRDAGWSSAGDRANAELRAISTGRGPLRRVLDDLRPMDAGAR